MATPRLCMLLTDGPGLRNFAAPRFLQIARQLFRVEIWHPMPPSLASLYTEGRGDDGVTWQPLRRHQVSPATGVLRATIGYAHLFWADTGGMRYNRSTRVRGPLRSRAVVHGTRLLGWLSASPRRMRLLETWYHSRVASAAATRAYRATFARTRPHVLFCSNQRAEPALPAVLAARSLGIPTATFIFSWDNITSKGRTAAPFDHFLVWSPLMRDELLRVYPDVSADRVQVVGTPQFDGRDLADRLWSRESLCARIGADPARPLLFYTGGDPTLYTAEHEYVQLLLELQRDGAIPPEAQVVVRPSPADTSCQYEDLRRAFPSLLIVPPDWVSVGDGHWDTRFPRPADADLLTNLVRHADVNINLNSTMTLECALHDRPVVNIAFDLRHPPPFGRPLAEFFDLFEHYQPVVRLGAARRALTPAQLAEQITMYLRSPDCDRDGRAAFAALEVDDGPPSSSERVIAALARIAGVAPPVVPQRDAQRATPGAAAVASLS